MRLVRCLAVLVVGGCSGAALPSASASPDAMEIVWEQTYGMDIASAPRVEWFDGCRTETGADLRQIASTTYLSGCIAAVVHSDGRIELLRTGKISDSRFAAALRQWKQWLLTTDMAPHWSPGEVEEANRALRDYGL